MSEDVLNLYFIKEEHSFFDDLVTLIVSLSSYEFAMHVGLASNNSRELHERSLSEWKGYIRPLKDIEYPIYLEERATKKLLLIYAAEILAYVYLNAWPQFIRCGLNNPITIPSDRKFVGSNYPHIASQLVGASFVNYYSRQEDTIKSRFGTKQENWPEVIGFAWALRNGFAHGNGCYRLSNPKVKFPWKIWTIDRSCDGQPILFGHNGLGIGDVIRLMEEIDRILK